MYFLYYYTVLLPIVILSFFVDKKTDKFLATVITISYLLLFGLAYRFGVDWIAYESSYNQSLDDNYFEIGYRIIEEAGRTFNINYWFFSFLIKICYWFFILNIAFKLTEHKTFFIYIFMLLATVFLNDFIRQLLAAIFILIGISFYYRKPLRFLLLVAIATFIHRSAILALPFYFIYKFKSVEKIIIITLTITFFGSLLDIYIAQIITNIISNYITNSFIERVQIYASFNKEAISIGHVMRFAMLALTLLIYHTKGKEEKEKDRWAYVGFICALMYEMIFYDINTLWTRAREYFVFFIPLFLLTTYRKRKYYVILFLFLYSYYTFFGIYKNNYGVFKNYSNYQNSLQCWIGDCYKKSLERENEVNEYWKYWLDNKL